MKRQRQRHAIGGRHHRWGLAVSLLMGQTFIAAPAQQAADSGDGATLREVIVTAQRYRQNLQNVPISVEVLDGVRLQSLQTTDLPDFVKLIPSLTIQSEGPGRSRLVMRGIENTNEFSNSGTQPSVAVYVDDMPVTALDANLDLHTYDLARIEALSGPQGSLFGSSSLAGVVRYVTNAPDLAGFAAGYDLTGTSFTAGSLGDRVEGFVNLPLGARAAVRLVGFQEHDGGFINNIRGPPETFPSSGLPRSNAALVRAHFNEIDSSGGRAALRIDLTGHWVLDASLIGQRAINNGINGYSPAFGALNLTRYLPDHYEDRWWFGTIKLQGSVGPLETSLMAGYLRRHTNGAQDNSGFSYFTDVATAGAFGQQIVDDQGQLIDPSLVAIFDEGYETQVQELRVATPSTGRLRATAGLFAERQRNPLHAETDIAGYATQYSITNRPGVYFLDSELRMNRDRAAYLDVTAELAPRLMLSAGIRWFGYDNTDYGFSGTNGKPTFFGFTANGGEANCFPGTVNGSSLWPCANVDSRATRHGETHRVVLHYQVDPERLLYATWSTGYRPGGTNVLYGAPSYAPDFLSNVELGAKTQWLGGRLRFNAALFLERWKDAQRFVAGPEDIGLVINAPRADSRGIEADLVWQATPSITLSASGAFTDARLRSNVCVFPSPSQTCTEPNLLHDAFGNLLAIQPNSILAYAGWRLPSSPRFKGDLTARDEFALAGGTGFVQAQLSGQTNFPSDLNVFVNDGKADSPGFASVDLSLGFRRDRWRAELFVHNLFDSHGAQGGQAHECDPSVCTLLYVVPLTPRLIGITIGQTF